MTVEETVKSAKFARDLFIAITEH